MDASQTKVTWEGEVVSVQPRSTVWRYLLDNRTHREIGYNVFVRGSVNAAGDGGQTLELSGRGAAAYDFCVAISGKQQEKLRFRIGDRARGTAWTPLYPDCEFADLYRAGALKVVERADAGGVEPAVATDVEPYDDATPIPRVFSSDYPGPPWAMVPPPLDVYSWRGARMLAKLCWKGKCFRCVWASMANATIQYDFDRGIERHRFEPFCYGPLSCRNYKMGPARSVPYKGFSGVKDEGWLDEICVEWRSGPDE